MYWQIVHFLESFVSGATGFAQEIKTLCPVVVLASLRNEREVDAFETECHSDPSSNFISTSLSMNSSSFSEQNTFYFIGIDSILLKI